MCNQNTAACESAARSNPSEIGSLRPILRVAILAALGTIACPPAPADAQTTSSTAQTSRVIRHAKGRILVQPKKGLSDAEFDKILKPHGGRRMQRLSGTDVFVVELPAQASEIAVANALKGNGQIKFAELDEQVEPSLTVNDPYFGSAWHLPKIGAASAWDISTGGSTIIAILDSGVDATHPDFEGKLVAGRNVFDGNNNTTDVFGHGTIVAGTAAAAGNNAIGVVGVSFGSKIMPIRVTDTSGYAYYSTLSQGITWAADNGARVANISFQGATGSSTVTSAAQYMRSKGGVVVTAAGNSGVQESYPPTDYVTVVTATDSANNVTSWSTYGNFVDVSAPGAGIYSTTRGGGYTAATGTSVASPVVAGVYALMIGANPTLQPATLDSILFSTSSDLGAAGKDTKAGWGMVNSAAAVARAAQTVASDTTAPAVSIGSPAASSTVSGLVAVDVAASDNIGVTRVELHVNGALLATDTASPFAFSWNTSTAADGQVTLLAKAYDSASNVGTKSITVTVANDTVAPTVAIQSPASGSTVSGTVSINATASDNNRVSRMTVSIDGKEVAQSFGASISYSWDASASTSRKGGGKKTSGTTSQNRSIKVMAYDPAGNSASATSSVTTQ